MSQFDLGQPDDVLARQVFELPEDGNPFDAGLRPLIEGKEGERDLPRASRIIGLAVDMCERDSLKWLALNLYQLEVERRPPNADMNAIIPGLTATLAAISKLAPDMARFGVLIGDSCYNLGIAHRMTKEYATAAEDQTKAAACYIMAGRSDKAWSSLFLVLVESFTAACVDGNANAIELAFYGLIGIRDAVESLFPGDSMPGWLKKNRQPHCLMAATWANQGYDALDSDISFCRTALADTHLGALAEVIGKPNDEIVAAAEDMASRFWNFPSSSTGDAVLTALLAGAHSPEAHNQSKADELYRRILTWAGNDGGAPLAIARRALLEAVEPRR